MKKKLLIAYLRIINKDMINLKLEIMECLNEKLSDSDKKLLECFESAHTKIKDLITQLTN